MTRQSISACPVCGLENTYPDGDNFICPDCSNEWLITAHVEVEEKGIHKDAHGSFLNDGDTVTLIKDLKVKGLSLVINGGTNIKKIRLVDGDHDINWKVCDQHVTQIWVYKESLKPIRL